MDVNDKSETYQRIKNWLCLVQILLTAALLLVCLGTGLSWQFADWAKAITLNAWGVVFFYFLFFSLFFLLFDLPLSFYSSYVLEHRYALSNQNLKGWVWDLTKKSVLSFVFAAFMIEMAYAVMRWLPSFWWLLAWAGWLMLSLVLGKLFPVIIIPLFYKYQDLEDHELKDKIKGLLEKYRFPVKDVYGLNLSKTTKKANAAFCGFGSTRRVILSDTLIQDFNHREIETVVAHELGHYKRHHIWKHMLLSAGISLVGFYAANQILIMGVSKLGMSGVSDVAGFPLFCLVLFCLGLLVMPLTNAYSRKHEFEADKFAMDEIKEPETFVSMMEKLAQLNLANPNPHPVIEFLLYDHPSIARRIARAKA